MLKKHCFFKNSFNFASWRVMALGLICLFSLLPSAVAEPTFTRSEAFGDWLLQCFTVEIKKGQQQERCSLTQGVGTEKVKLIASLSVVKESKKQLLRLTVPLGISLSHEVSMKSTTGLGDMKWLTCINSGCLAEKTLDTALIKKLAGKKKLILTVKTLKDKRDLILQFSLKGLAQGIAKTK
ncbi:MAG: invasion associated locus B family protein [Mariprofundaceae bacterium]|nr:invasion associated locus B family protein [Mariprofundaceae bacterium]